jgi:hypothetical protein
MHLHRPYSRPSACATGNQAGRVRARWLLVAAVLTGLLLMGGLLARAGVSPTTLWLTLNERPTMDMVRYLERRLEGHPRLETLASPVLGAVRARIEREPPAVLFDLGKGQRPLGVTTVAYDAQGKPQAAQALSQALRPPSPDRLVASQAQLAEALDLAGPGEVVELAPGSYAITGRLATGRAGTALQPIRVRARQAGTVTLVVNSVQAVVVSQPYWVFENLDWRGACTHDSNCEHALHVVGRARGTVILNNRMTDFNAHVKVNGEDGQFPDDGLLQFTTLHNTRPRNTNNPVTPFDLVAASGWQLLDNRVENFSRRDSPAPSYGLFMKGAGSGGRIERNLVVCSPSGISAPGLRVGLSLGAGGTGQSYCRDGRCDAEHIDGLIANNVVAHCNDAGIDVSKAVGSRVLHNTLINTRGVLVRNPPATAAAVGNLLDDGLRARQGTQLEERRNIVERALQKLLQDPDALDLRWLQLPAAQDTPADLPLDFCGKPRPALSPPGATLAARC